MAVMNNWDLKDNNNSIYLTRGEPAEERYVVSDLGQVSVLRDWTGC
jgi:hypothetical protein